jgi:F-type H+-transporting ATPase subunit gamma
MSSGALKELRGRIRSVISIQQTTRAMRMISAVKLRRAQDRLQRLRPYRDAAQTILQTLFAQLEEPHPYQLSPNASKTLYVVLSSSRGLCGAFNSGLVRWLLPQLPPPSETHLLILGKKAYEMLRRTPYPHTFEDLFGGKEVALPAVSALAQRLLTAFQNGEYRAIVLVYNRFKGIGRSLPTMETLLPLSVSAAESPKPWLLEPSAEALVESFLPIYVEAVLLGRYRSRLRLSMPLAWSPCRPPRITPKSFCARSASPTIRPAKPPSPKSSWKSSLAPKPSKAK